MLMYRGKYPPFSFPFEWKLKQKLIHTIRTKEEFPIIINNHLPSLWTLSHLGQSECIQENQKLSSHQHISFTEVLIQRSAVNRYVHIYTHGSVVGINSKLAGYKSIQILLLAVKKNKSSLFGLLSFLENGTPIHPKLSYGPTTNNDI